MAVKCNIVGLVLDELYKQQFGLECEDSTNGIIENYIEYLNCDIGFVPCGTATDCSEASTTHKCKFVVKKIVIVSQDLNTIVYGVELVGGLAPYTYEWAFDISDFDNSGAINTSEATLTVKADKDLSILVSPVSVTVTDAEGCTYTKTCTLVSEELKCNANYASCPNISNLQVFSKMTYCARPINLIVTNT